MEYYTPVRPTRTREDESRIINRMPSSRGEFIRLRHLILTDPSLFPRPISDDDVAGTIAICSNIVSAVFSGIYDLSDRTLYLLAETANNLTGVDLTGCSHITDLGVIELTKHGLPLEWIRLNAAVGINGACVTSISKSCPKLLEIELCDLPLLSAPPVRDLWLYSRKLRTVRLGRCPLLTDKAFPMPPTRSGRRTSSANSSAEFNVNKPLPPEPLSWIDELPPLYLTHRAENLRILDLSNCTRLTDKAFDGIVGHAPYIHTLLLSACTNLTDRALESISKLGDSLEVLVIPHVANITDRGIIKLTRSCTRLKAIDLACMYVWSLSIGFSLTNVRIYGDSLSQAHGYVCS
jgi:F-box and leucine-rich repeat protein GRR1